MSKKPAPIPQIDDKKAIDPSPATRGTVARIQKQRGGECIAELLADYTPSRPLPPGLAERVAAARRGE